MGIVDGHYLSAKGCIFDSREKKIFFRFCFKPIPELNLYLNHSELMPNGNNSELMPKLKPNLKNVELMPKLNLKHVEI